MPITITAPKNTFRDMLVPSRLVTTCMRRNGDNRAVAGMRPPAPHGMLNIAQKEIIIAVIKLADNPRPHRSKSLMTRPSEYRFHISDYCVVYEINDGRTHRRSRCCGTPRKGLPHPLTKRKEVW
ncbi:MAG: type II toxin-antitoxin system RelE family toxin [Pseudonocardiaceae bacterium]